MVTEQRYCLYIDESGVPELSAKSHFFILSGVLIKEEDEKVFLFLINRVKKKYKLDFSKHLHAVDIFENISEKCFLGKTLRRPSKDLRSDFQVDMWNLIKDYSIYYYAVTVSKEHVKTLLGLRKRDDHGQSWIESPNFYARVDRQLPMDIGANAIYHWAISRITKKDKLKIIFESRTGDLFTVKNFSYIQDKHVFKNLWMQVFSKRMKERVVYIAFANKSVKSAGLELADLISYTCNLYFLQIKKNIKSVDLSLKKAILFRGTHKTLNNKHYKELDLKETKKYLPGLNSRTKRIAKHYEHLSYSLSPANARSQMV